MKGHQDKKLVLIETQNSPGLVIMYITAKYGEELKEGEGDVKSK